MNTVFLAVITIAFVVLVIMFFYITKDVRRSLATMDEFMKRTEDTLNPALEELQRSLRSVRNVTENITDMTDDVKTLTSSVREVGENIQQASRNIASLTTTSIAQTAGLKAGLKAGMQCLLSELLKKK